MQQFARRSKEKLPSAGHIPWQILAHCRVITRVPGTSGTQEHGFVPSGLGTCYAVAEINIPAGDVRSYRLLPPLFARYPR
eukprot:2214775-Rhodomonas_salina.1